jgi:thiol-disulfide isomerase/thioredoxin
MIKLPLFLFFCVLKYQLCLGQGYTITANLTGFPNGTRFSLEELSSRQKIGAAVITDGKFVLKGTLDEYPAMLVLQAFFNNKGYTRFILMGHESVFVKGDTSDFPFSITVTGSKYEDENEILKRQTRPFDILRDSISKGQFELIKDTSKEGRSRIYNIAKQQAYYDQITDSITIDYLKTHLHTYAGINQLYYFRKKFNKDTLNAMFNSLPDELKESVFGRKLFTYVKIGSVLKVNDSAADFEAVDKNGKKHRLIDIRGKLVLLDFTQSYCVPCVRAVKELKEVAQKYSDNLTIISFNTDKLKQTWMSGLKRDTSDWLHVWDGKGSASETPLKYGVTSYPTFVLISAEGKILSIFPGYGEGNIHKEVSKQLSLN